MVNSTASCDGDDTYYNSLKSVINSKCNGQFSSEGLVATSAIQIHSASAGTHTSDMSELSVWGSNGAATSTSSNALGWGSYMPSVADTTKLPSNMQLTGQYSVSSASSINNAPAWGNAAALTTQGSNLPTTSESDDAPSATSLTSDVAGRTTPVWQGMNFGPGFQNMGQANDSWGVSGNGDATSVGTSSSNSAWGVSSPSTSVWGSLSSTSGANANTSNVSGWPNTSPNTTGNCSVSGVSAWEKNSQQTQWGPTVPTTTWGGATITTTNDPPKTQPSTFAQAAGKGLNLKSNTNVTNVKEVAVAAVLSSAEQLEKQRKLDMQRVIDCPDGWGAKPVRQDYAWDVKVSPNTKRKQAEENKPNVWNNYNGTAIWEASKENPQVWLDSAEGSTKSQYDDEVENGSSIWNGTSTGRTPSDSSPCPWPVDKPQVQWPGANISQPPPGWNPPKHDTPAWPPNTSGATGDLNNIVKDRNSWSQPPPQLGDPSWPSSAPAEPQSTQWPQNTGMATAPNIAGMVPQGKPAAVPGWGNNSPPIALKSDDGTQFWGSTAPVPNANATNPCNWGQDQWNGGQVKKVAAMPANNSQSWSESSDANWNSIRKMSETSWRDGSSYGSESDVFSETDTGTWNDTMQEANSTWSSASGWKNRANLAPRGTPRFPLTSAPTNSGPPQMRVKLLQQLLDRGYKKEDAQNALISNNMNLESAVADLRVSGIVPDLKDGEIDVFIEGSRPPTHKLPAPAMPRADDFMANMPPTMQHNAQMPPSMFNKSSSLGSSSPGGAAYNPVAAAAALQQKVLQQKMLVTEPPPPINGGLPMPGQMPPPMQSVQQQQTAQQLILHQIHMAHKSGFIDKSLFNQLLSQQLPRRLLTLVQQLLQQLTLLQNFVNTQQALQQNKNGLNQAMQRQKQEQCSAHIQTVKFQILNLQKKIRDEQNAAVKPSVSIGETSPISCGDSASDALQQFNNFNLAMSSQPQSRLPVWRQRRSPDKELDNPASIADPKTLHQSHSTPSLTSGAFETFGYGDATWSANSSANWPPPFSSSEASLAPAVENKVDSIHSSNASNLDATQSTFPPEFIPGKLWQGASNNNIEDDPHITPGSYTRSISINTIKDDSLSNLAKKKEMIGSMDAAPTSLTSQLWGARTNNISRPPPGLGQQNKAWSSMGMQRQQSWAGSTGSAFTPVNGSGMMSNSWDRNRPPTGFWIMLRNLSPQIDHGTLRTICQQHGPLLQFVMFNGQAMVQYATREEAMKAQKCLHNCSLGNIPMIAELVSDVDASKLAQQDGGGGVARSLQTTQSQPRFPPRKDAASVWNQGPAYSQYSSGGGGNAWNNYVWAAGDDQMNPNQMLGNLLGGESM